MRCGGTASFPKDHDESRNFHDLFISVTCAHAAVCSSWPNICSKYNFHTTRKHGLSLFSYLIMTSMVCHTRISKTEYRMKLPTYIQINKEIKQTSRQYKHQTQITNQHRLQQTLHNYMIEINLYAHVPHNLWVETITETRHQCR